MKYTNERAACVTAPVLVLEDDDDIRDVLRLVLEDAGYTVREAPNGLTGLALLRESAEPLVVLLDWWMPRLGGKQVLRAAAREPRLARHAYALLTAADDARWPNLEDTWLEDMAVPVLAKPFDIEVVVALVDRLQRLLRGARTLPLRPAHSPFDDDELLRDGQAPPEQAAG